MCARACTMVGRHGPCPEGVHSPEGLTDDENEAHGATIQVTPTCFLFPQGPFPQTLMGTNQTCYFLLKTCSFSSFFLCASWHSCSHLNTHLPIIIASCVCDIQFSCLYSHCHPPCVPSCVTATASTLLAVGQLEKDI